MTHRRLRVAMFTDVFPRLSNTFILNQITGLIDRGHEVDIFSRAQGDFGNAHEEVTSYGLRSRMAHLPVPSGKGSRMITAARLLARPGAWSPGVLGALNVARRGQEALSLVPLYTALSLAGRPRYDVFHCQFAKLAPGLLPLIAARGLHEPLVTAFRGADLTRHLQREPRLYRNLFRRGQLFLPVSENFKRRLVAAGCPEERVVVHHSGIVVERFPFKERRREPEEPTRLLFIGRLTEKKGLRYAFEALAQVRTSGRKVLLKIIGDGEDRDELTRYAGELGISTSVEMLGRQTSDQVVRHLEQSHLLIAPSVTAGDGDQEGIPNVLKEAMAMGLPVLSTQHSGIPELVEHGVSGYLVPERDSKGLAHRLLQLIDQPESWPSFGRAGRAKVEAEFDSAKLNDELVELYRRPENQR